MANQTVYPYGTGGSLPSSIGIINDLVTGGADKALSAEQGKVLDEEISQLGLDMREIIGEGYYEEKTDIDLNTFTVQNCSLGGSKKWYMYGAMGRHIAIPVTSGQKMQLALLSIAGDTESDGNGFYGFVTSSYNSPYATNDLVPYVTGGDRIAALIAYGYVTITAPEDAAYLILTTVDGAGNAVAWALQSITAIQPGDKESIDSRLQSTDEVVEIVEGVPSQVQTEIPWNDYGYQTNNTRIYAYLTKTIKDGDVVNVNWLSIGNYEYDIIVLTANTWGQGDVVSETGWITDLSYTKTINATESGNYIRIQIRDANNASIENQIPTIQQNLSLSYIRTTVENVNGLVQYVGEPPLGVDSAIDLSGYAENLGSLGSQKWFIDTSNPIQRHIAIPVTPGNGYRIKLDTLSAGDNGYWVFATNAYVVPAANNAVIPNATDEPKRHLLSVGSYTDVIAPIGAAYLIITTVDGGGAVSTWNLWSLKPYLEQDLFTSVEDLQKSVQFAKVRVASWNLGHFSLGTSSDTAITHSNYATMRQKWAEKINEIDADIFCCCEYNTNFVNESGSDPAITARDAIFSLYSAASVGAKDAYNQNAMFANCKLKDIKSVAYDNHTQGRYYIVNTATIGGKEVKVVATHLDFNQGTTGQQNRALQMQQLISDFANDDYVIICADWNTTDGGSEFDVFTNAGYKMANHGYLGDIMTYPAGETPEQILDNIVVKGFAVNGIHIVNDATLTDHCAVYCDLTLTPTV